MKKSVFKGAAIAVIIAAIIVVSNSLFILNEDESAIVERFGRIESVYVKEASPELIAAVQGHGDYQAKIYEGTGLKFKAPFLDNCTKYSSKLMTYDTPARQVIAADKKTLYFDNNAQWKISNPMLFRISVGNIATARDRIDSVLYSLMRQKVGKLNSTTLIADKLTIEDLLMQLDKEVTNETMKFGVTVFDIRIKRTDLPQENYESIYNRMITERNRIAAQYRSEGDEQAIELKSKTDREATIIRSKAAWEAEKLKGEGDSEAARIYNAAYGKNPAFFEFYNMLETYKTTLGGGTTLVIPVDSPFAKYLLGD